MYIHIQVHVPSRENFSFAILVFLFLRLLFFCLGVHIRPIDTSKSSNVPSSILCTSPCIHSSVLPPSHGSCTAGALDRFATCAHTFSSTSASSGAFGVFSRMNEVMDVSGASQRPSGASAAGEVEGVRAADIARSSTSAVHVADYEYSKEMGIG
ncbi:hypothetical protein FIBSPDRAFT_194292 [Athelia psychrophila]|uniref:Uncharacterized protein n=1 Tax=Athelia psychrophila TaxID=1759441 RepID=A0A166SKE7_9AGAM|nr:hypothetical protein FIBSPDRAFT_194292 [Fibularhizoctonia sp. CBS 109695]